MKKITEIAHDLLLECQKECAVDFTCGNGYDTQFLSTQFHKVFAFDIQKCAIENTKKRCNSENVECILDSHANAHKYIPSFHAGIFNCGYLPHGDENITTSSNTVIPSLENVLPLLEVKGRIVIVLYPGFEAGNKEAMEVEKYVTSLSGKIYDVCKIQVLNRNNVPYILMIEKIHKS